MDQQKEELFKLEGSKTKDEAESGHDPGLSTDSRTFVRRRQRRLLRWQHSTVPSRVLQSPKISLRSLHAVKEHYKNSSYVPAVSVNSGVQEGSIPFDAAKTK